MELADRIRKLEALLEDSPGDAAGFFMLGRLYHDAGRYEDGARAFKQAIESQPDYSAAYRQAGDCLRLSGRTDEAREVYEQGIAIADDKGDLQTVKEIRMMLRKLE